jgi:hypothetical protein
MSLAVYYVVFEDESGGNAPPAEPTFEAAKVLEGPKNARVIKVEAESAAEASQICEHFYPGDFTGTPVIVTEAAWKETLP